MPEDDMASGLDWIVAAREAAGRRGDRSPVERIRDAAWSRFLARGFPTTREEEWRFTSVAPIAAGSFSVVSRSAAAPVDERIPYRIPDAAAELVFVDGHYVAAVSNVGTLPDGVRIDSLASRIAANPGATSACVGQIALLDGSPFIALNLAFLDDGAVIELPASAIVTQPIHLVFMSTGRADGSASMAHPHVIIALRENARASIVETYAGPDDARYFTNVVTEIALGENAVLEHHKLQCEGAEAFHVGATHVHARRSATFVSHAISLGGALVRNDLTAVLDGEGVECTLNGLYASDGGGLVDNHTTIDHAKPHCGSREIYKGILAGRSRGVFNGKIIVRPDAQQTDAKQTNRALLLSEDARINTKPQLEIFANDVKCTHGAAVGQLDDEALFYLRSRGISGDAARRLLIHAFAADVLNRIPLLPVRAAAQARLQAALAQALSPAA
jgi:Fe-S cluster assembly protein SufD